VCSPMRFPDGSGRSPDRPRTGDDGRFDTGFITTRQQHDQRLIRRDAARLSSKSVPDLARLAALAPKVVVLDGRAAVPCIDSDLGFLTVAVPRGRHHVDVSFENTLIRTLGNAISVASAVAFVALVLVSARWRA
jgi:hypothetical protein